MNALTTTNQPSNLHLEQSYKIKVTRHEWRFLVWLHPNVVTMNISTTLTLLKMCVYHEWHTKRIAHKPHPTEDVKVKFSTADLIALKLILIEIRLPPAWNDDRNALLAKIDPLTVGIH